MKNVKLVVSDIDGTLIDSHLECPKRNVEGIDYIRSQGIPFAIATGRPFKMVEKNLKQWDLENRCDYFVCNNGATVIDYKTKKEFNQNCLSKETLHMIYDLFHDLEASICVYEGDTLVTDKITEAYEHRCKVAHIHKKQVDFKEYVQTDYPKMLIVSSNEVQKEIIKRFEQIKPDSYRMFASSSILTEVVNPNLSKVAGIDVLCKQLHIKRENVLCFGDEMNDYEMLSHFVGVAMENAVQNVKEVCKFETKSCDDGGVGEFLLTTL